MFGVESLLRIAQRETAEGFKWTGCRSGGDVFHHLDNGLFNAVWLLWLFIQKL